MSTTNDSCPHTRTKVLYEQLAPTKGRAWKGRGRICKDCGQVLPKEDQHAD